MMVLCKNNNCAHNEEGACSVRGEIQLDELANCTSKILVEEPESKPEVNNKSLEGKVICLDSGHCRDANKCPAIPEYSEAKVMWQLHLMLKAHLEALGAKVILTRPNQSVDKALKERGMTAKDCDLFISLHSNAVGNGMNENVDHVAVYHLVEDISTTCDDTSKEIAKVLAPVIANAMGTKQGYKILTRKSSNDRNGDGVLNDNYYGVLNGARLVDVPGLILEHSFHTNSKSVRWLLQDANLDRLAKVEAEALAKYFSGKDVELKEQQTTVPYCIRIANVPENDVLNIRKQPDVEADKTGALAYNDPHKYTIVEERNGWGRLKSGVGWIKLKYTVRAV